MRIDPPKRWELIVGAGLWLFAGAISLFFIGYPSGIGIADVLWFCFCISLGLVAAYGEAIRRSRVVVVDVPNGIVFVRRRSWLWQERCERYSLARFGRVRSIVGNIGKHNSVHVDLIERESGSALTLALYSPSSDAKSFMDIPTDREPWAAAELRREIARETGLIDSGFEGNQFPPPRAKVDGCQ